MWFPSIKERVKGVSNNFRGISMLTIPGKVFGRVVIDRIRDATEWRMGEEQ